MADLRAGSAVLRVLDDRGLAPCRLAQGTQVYIDGLATAVAERRCGSDGADLWPWTGRPQSLGCKSRAYRVVRALRDSVLPVHKVRAPVWAALPPTPASWSGAPVSMASGELRPDSRAQL